MTLELDVSKLKSKALIFSERLCELSESKEYKDAIFEWTEYYGYRVSDIYGEGGYKEYCLCTHEIEHVFIVGNVINDNEIKTGCDCVGKFFRGTRIWNIVHDIKTLMGMDDRKVKFGTVTKGKTYLEVFNDKKLNRWVLEKLKDEHYTNLLHDVNKNNLIQYLEFKNNNIDGEINNIIPKIDKRTKKEAKEEEAKYTKLSF